MRAKQRLLKIDTQEVSLVDVPANLESFAVVKSQGDPAADELADSHLSNIRMALARVAAAGDKKQRSTAMQTLRAAHAGAADHCRSLPDGRREAFAGAIAKELSPLSTNDPMQYLDFVSPETGDVDAKDDGDEPLEPRGAADADTIKSLFAPFARRIDALQSELDTIKKNTFGTSKALGAGDGAGSEPVKKGWDGVPMPTSVEEELKRRRRR